MSAFLHEPIHFNSVEASIIKHMNIRGFEHVWDVVTTSKQVTDIIDDFRRISVMSIFSRDNDMYELCKLPIELDKLFKNKNETIKLNSYDLVMAMDSIEYQISFTEFPRPFTKDEVKSINKFRELKSIICESIVKQSLKYQNSRAWEIQ